MSCIFLNYGIFKLRESASPSVAWPSKRRAGFSVNKHIKLDNLAEDTFLAKRINCDHVTSVGGLQNIDASDKRLLLAASSVRQNYLEAEKQKKECNVNC